MSAGGMRRRLHGLAALALLLAAAPGLSGCGWVRVEGTPAEAPAARAAVDPAPGGAVVVRGGDTLYSIARRNNVPLRGLIAANGLQPPYTIQPGDRLALPPPPRMHVVRPGDTVYGISRRYGVDVTSVVKANDISPPYTIVAGQALVVPEGDLDELVAEAPQMPQAPAPSPADRSVQAEELPAPPRTEPSAEAKPADPPPASGPLPKPLSGPVRFVRPLEGRILSSYGPKSGGLHNDGINIAAPRGAPVRAAEAGVVAYAGSELPGFGNLILLKHAEGWTTAYGHNEAVLVKRGDRVARGQTIARVGSSGNVSNPQLHFEIRRGARAIDPAPYFRKGAAVSVLPAHHKPVALDLVALQPIEEAEAEQRPAEG